MSGRSAIRRVCILVCLVTCVIHLAPVATAQQADQPSTTQELGAAKQDPDRSQSADRIQRIHAWIGAWQRVVTKAAGLTEQQSARLHQHLIETASTNQARWLRLKQESTTPDTAVHWFMGYTGPVWQLTRAFEFQAKRSLDKNQWDAYTTWRDRHQQRVAEFFSRRAVAVMHDDLFLTPTQRAICESCAADWNSDHPNGVFLLRRPNQIASAKPLRQLVAQLPDNLLTFNQRLRLDYIRDASNQLKMDSRTSFYSTKRRIAEIDQRFGEDGLNAVVVRVEYLTAMLSLSHAQNRRLTLAGKGAVRRLRQSWREAAQNTVVQMEVGNTDEVIVPLSLPEEFAADELWTNALNNLDVDSKAAKDTDAVAHRGAIGLVMGILDQELILDDSQIASLQQLVQQTEPERVITDASNMPEIAMVARTLVRIDHEAVSTVLAPPQRECWRQLRNVFSFNGLDSASIRWMSQSPNLRLTDSAS